MEQNWKLANNYRLPPTTNNYWSYGQDSWTWQPKQYEIASQPPISENSISKSYYSWIDREKTTNKPQMVYRGGSSKTDIQSLVNATLLDYPDIKSETLQSQIILANLEEKIKHFLPKSPIY